MVTTVERIIDNVFMEALAYPSVDCEDDAANCPMVKTHLLPSLRSFCSVLKGMDLPSYYNIRKLCYVRKSV